MYLEIAYWKDFDDDEEKPSLIVPLFGVGWELLFQSVFTFVVNRSKKNMEYWIENTEEFDIDY